MIRVIPAVAIFCAGLFIAAQAQDTCIGCGVTGMYKASGGGCSQYTTLAASLDGSQNASAVRTLICGMVTDGTYSGFDLLYVAATNSEANFKVNWANPGSFGLTKNGTITFTANSYVTGDGSTGYYDTNYNISTNATNFTRNSGSMGTCVVNARSSGTSAVAMGTAASGSFYSYIEPYYTTSPGPSYDINGESFNNYAASNSRGSWVAIRSSSSTVSLYLNGSSVASVSTDTSGAPSNNRVFLSALGDGTAGSNTASQFSSDNLAYFFVGTGFTGTQIGNIYSRLHTYLQAVGETTAC